MQRPLAELHYEALRRDLERKRRAEARLAEPCRLRLLLLLAAGSVIIPYHCAAAGYPSIDGVTRDGYAIGIEFEVSPPRVNLWLESADDAVRQRSSRVFEAEPCRLSERNDHRGRLVRSLACAANAKSPLAGTTYRATQVDGICENGDPDFVYVCVAGCDRNKRAPRRMEQQHWEC